MLSEAEKAYVAGILDADGHFGIEKRRAHQEHVSVQHKPSVKVIMASEAVPRWLQDRWPGWYSKWEPSQRGRRVVWSWQVKTSDLEKFLEQVVPYLVGKQLEAQLLLQFLKGRTFRGGRRVSEEELAWREMHYQLLKLLHK